MKRTTILQQLLINIIAPLIFFILALSAYNYYTEREKLSENLENDINKFSNEIQNMVDLYDQAMLSHEEAFNQRMQDLSERIYEEEIRTGKSLNTLDLYKLSDKLGMDTLKESIYILDTNCVVCNTTFYKDRNLDFIKLDSKFQLFFDELRQKNKFTCDRFGVEVNTGQIKKYSYLPSSNGQYIIELGFYSNKANELKTFLLDKVKNASKNYSSLTNVKFENVIKDIPSYGFGEKFKDIVNQAAKEKQTKKITEDINGLKVTNRFIYISIANAGLYDCYILNIETNNSKEKVLLQQELMRFVKILLLFILPLSLLVIYRARSIIKPLKNLSAKTNRIRKGNLNEKADISGASEIAELSTNFNHMVDELRESYQGLEQKVKDRTKEIEHQKEVIEEKQKEIVDSINYAKRIQHTLLANKDLLIENLPEHFVFFNPKDIVSGDFYWATSHNNRFYIAACDSTGHGVPGAFMSLLNIGFLREAINEKDIVAPHEVLNFVRQRLIDNISKEGQKDGFDGILLCIDKNNNSITYAAANNAPVIVKNGEYTELHADRMPVGKGEKDLSFTLKTIEIEKGDVLFLYTDGYADQFGGPKGKKFKYRPLNELLTSISDKACVEQEKLLFDNFVDWRGDLEQVDDVLVIGIKFN